MVIRVSRYVAINTPNGGGAPPAIAPFTPGDLFTGGVRGFWMGRLEVEGGFDPRQLFGESQAGTWFGGVAPFAEDPA